MKLSKHSLLIKSAQLALTSVLSKCLGILREVLQIKFLGAGQIADSFAIAYRIPNLLRKIFAEGSLGASAIPVFIKLLSKNNNNSLNKLVSLLSIFVGALFLFLCVTIAYYSNFLILLFAPGFLSKVDEFLISSDLLKILIFISFFSYMSSLIIAVLHAINCFNLAALGPIIVNIIYIIALILGIYFDISIKTFSFILVFASFLQYILNLSFYFKNGFRFVLPDYQSFIYLKDILIKFVPCLFSIAAVEINLIIDSRFASTLPTGSLTLLNLSSRFMTVALSVFAISFSSILLSHFSRIVTHSPKRLNFYILESSKFILFFISPIIIFITIFANDIFFTLFKGFLDIEQIKLAARLLMAFNIGLLFLSINKIFLSLYYALGYTLTTSFIAFIGTLSNIILNKILIKYFAAVGIALSTSISAIIQTILFVFILNNILNFKIYFYRFFIFLLNYLLQLSILSFLFYSIIMLIRKAIILFMPISYSTFFLNTMALWFWIVPIFLVYFYTIYRTRGIFNNKIYFLD